jgi:MOSC domain-containing protein YiiM
MFEGKLEAIFIGPTKAGPMQRVETAEAVAGGGLKGDRYSIGDGTFSKTSSASSTKHYPADRQITLIEVEALEAAERDYELPIDAGQTRRNLLVRGVPLNHLVEKEFFVGDVRIRGLRLCEPCGHLEKLTKKGIKSALIHRGGLRAEILGSGALKIGDLVRPA